MTISITRTGNGRVKLAAPYHPGLPSRARALGGKFDPSTKTWHFDARDEERVREIARALYGTDGKDAPPLVTIRVNLDKIRPNGGSLWLAGREVAARLGRDLPARLGEGVIVISGGFPSTGGSRAHPRLEPKSGTVLEVRDVPEVLARAEMERWGEGIVIVESGPIDKEALLARKEALLRELAAIKRLLGEQ